MGFNAAVVTDESPAAGKRRTTKLPKIPDVCDALGVPWFSPWDFLEKVGLSF